MFKQAVAPAACLCVSRHNRLGELLTQVMLDSQILRRIAQRGIFEVYHSGNF